MIIWSFSIWTKLERWKGLVSGCLSSWLKVKNILFEVLFSLILLNNKEPFLDQVLKCDEKWILYDNQRWPDQWLDWEEAPEHFSNQTWPKEGHDHSLVVCCLSEPLYHSEPQWNHYIWEVCSANWWDAPKTAKPVAAALINRKGPNLHYNICTTSTSKAKWTGIWSSAS